MGYLPEDSADKILRDKYGKSKRKRTYKKGNLYNSSRWKRFSRWYRKDNPFCVVCDRLADDVDHITPIEEGGSLYGEDNLQSLCKSCHAKKSAKDRKKYR